MLKTNELIDALGRDAILQVCEQQLAVLLEEQDLLFNLVNHCNSEIAQQDDPVAKEMYKAQAVKLKNEQFKCRKNIKYWQSKMFQFSEHNDLSKNAWDLDAIKQVPITNFLGDPSVSSSTRRHYKAPWRDEKLPSLVVYTAGNSWYDFGASCGGSNIDFIMKKEGLDFKGAVKYLSSYL